MPERMRRPSARAALRVAAATILPPIVVVALEAWSHVVTDAEQRCLDHLAELDSPRLICSPFLQLLGLSIIVSGFHLLLALPGSWLLRSRFRPSVRGLCGVALAAVCASLVPIGIYRLRQELPAAAETVMVLVPFALCPVLALLCLEVVPLDAERS